MSRPLFTIYPHFCLLNGDEDCPPVNLPNVYNRKLWMSLGHLIIK